MNRIIVVLLVALTSTCFAIGDSQLAGYSSGQVGCAPEEIRISEHSTKNMVRTWNAHCRGRLYRCSVTGEQVVCQLDERTAQPAPAAPVGAAAPAAPGAPAPEPAPEVPSEPAGAPAVVGCQYDTQCKGDRICRDGSCVDPER